MRCVSWLVWDVCPGWYETCVLVGMRRVSWFVRDVCLVGMRCVSWLLWDVCPGCYETCVLVAMRRVPGCYETCVLVAMRRVSWLLWDVCLVAMRRVSWLLWDVCLCCRPTWWLLPLTVSATRPTPWYRATAARRNSSRLQSRLLVPPPTSWWRVGSRPTLILQPCADYRLVNYTLSFHCVRWTYILSFTLHVTVYVCLVLFIFVLVDDSPMGKCVDADLYDEIN